MANGTASMHHVVTGVSLYIATPCLGTSLAVIEPVRTPRSFLDHKSLALAFYK